MKKIFTQTAEHRIKNAPCSDYLPKLPEIIRKHTDWDYSYIPTDHGCLLKPTFRSMPYRNSFVPEMDIVVSHNDTWTVWHMSGQPVKSVRIFMVCCFSFLLIMEAVLLALAITSGLERFFPVFIPIVMGAFGFFLCRITTKTTFHSVVKAIQKESSSPHSYTIPT